MPQPVRFNVDLLMELYGISYEALWSTEWRAARNAIQEAVWREETQRAMHNAPIINRLSADPSRPYLVMVEVRPDQSYMDPEQVTIIPAGSLVGKIGATELPWYRHSGRRLT